MAKLLSVHEVADQLGVAPKTVRKWIKAGNLSSVKMPGGDYRFKQEHIDNWINKRTMKSWTI